MKKLLVSLIIALIFALPLFVFADGRIFIEPRPDIYMQETRQRAAIFYEDGVETLIVSTNFKGTARDFGWVIPTPSRPEVSKASMDVFQNLETITQKSYRRGYAKLDVGSISQEAGDAPYVAVVETKKVDYYNIDILESNDAKALSGWLAKNGYHFPEKERYILNDYIQNGWYFAAVKVDTSAQGSDRVNLALEEGHATPLKLVFETPNIVFPLKISSIKPEPPEAPASTPVFEKRAGGYAVLLPAKSYLISSISVIPLTAVSPKQELRNMTLSFWFKSDLSIADRLYQLFSIKEGINSRITVGFIASDISVNINGQVWTTQSSIALKEVLTNGWNEVRIETHVGMVPKLYLNGVFFFLLDPTRPKILYSLENPITLSSESVFVGDETNRIYNKPIAFDDITIAEEQEDECGVRAEGCFYEPNPVTILKIAFENDLKMYVNQNVTDFGMYESDLQYKSLGEPVVQNIGPVENEWIPIELYLITDHKQTATDFDTPYAGWIRALTIKELGVDVNGNPLVQPSGKKYFLTKLTRRMRQEEMTEDLFPRQADSDELVNARELPLFEGNGAVVWFVAISIIVSTGLLGLLIWWTMKHEKINNEK